MTREEERQRCFERIAKAATAMDVANRAFSAKDAELANARISDQVIRTQRSNDQAAIQQSLERGQKIKAEWLQAKRTLDAAIKEFQAAHKEQEAAIARHIREDQAKTAPRF